MLLAAVSAAGLGSVVVWGVCGMSVPLVCAAVHVPCCHRSSMWQAEVGRIGNRPHSDVVASVVLVRLDVVRLERCMASMVVVPSMILVVAGNSMVLHLLYGYPWLEGATDLILMTQGARRLMIGPD